jgi:hypothetical protein
VKVVAVAVFLALGFAFYVFFAPFVGKKLYQYIVMGLYTPLVSHFPLLLSSHYNVFSSFSTLFRFVEELRSVVYLLVAFSFIYYMYLFKIFFFFPPSSVSFPFLGFYFQHIFVESVH